MGFPQHGLTVQANVWHSGEMKKPSEAIMCADCQVPVESVADPSPSDLVTCPECGKAAPYEQVMQDVWKSISDRFDRAMGKAAASSKSLSWSVRR